MRRPRKDGTRQPEVRVRIVQERRKKVLRAFVGFSFLFLGGARARNMFLGSKWLSPARTYTWIMELRQSWLLFSSLLQVFLWPLPT